MRSFDIISTQTQPPSRFNGIAIICCTSQRLKFHIGLQRPLTHRIKLSVRQHRNSAIHSSTPIQQSTIIPLYIVHWHAFMKVVKSFHQEESNGTTDSNKNADDDSVSLYRAH
ncbi:unnamed protein product [Macrosiphum euphorbiae]|uniref:Uncharacterized protein n=1 Tax=Macrosiphum euphorbiae TaxID=13131 RepID=A0AAV0W7H3_9HEMI|nr:unnamed protein product [Macrosiphum euphorbiae]